MWQGELSPNFRLLRGRVLWQSHPPKAGAGIVVVVEEEVVVVSSSK